MTNSKPRNSSKINKKENVGFKPIFKLFGYGKRYLPLIIIAMISALVGAIICLVGPGQIGKITDIITEGFMVGSVDMSAIFSIALVLVLLYSFDAVSYYVEGWIMATVTNRLARNLRRDVDQKINKVPLKYYDKTTYGDVLSRITNDTTTISTSINSSFTALISDFALFLGSLLMMFITNWILALCALGSTIIGFGIMALILSRSQKYFDSQQEVLGNLNGHIEESYSAQNIIRSNNAIGEMKDKFNKQNQNLYKSAWKSQFFSGIMMPLMSFIGNFGYVVVCVVGVILAIGGSITFGVVVSFMIYIRFFTQPLSQIAQGFTALQSASAGCKRVFEFLEEDELADESHKTAYLNPICVRGDVEFKNVKFGYDKNKLVIKDFSASIKAGQKLAIVGPTGAGKTTLVNLLMRFYEVDSGKILIDGISTQSLTRENVHDMFSMVLQDTWIYEASVLDNIKYSKTDIPNERVFEACQKSGVEHFIKTLPYGYDTILNDETTISAGQKQLLTIARAMVQNSPMLILDEATSSVDTRTEILIQNAMDTLTKNKTSFVIAHRLSTIKNADLILVLKDGDIVEQGTHKELLAQNGFYAELYNSQFETEE